MDEMIYTAAPPKIGPEEVRQAARTLQKYRQGKGQVLFSSPIPGELHPGPDHNKAGHKELNVVGKLKCNIKIRF